MLRVGVNGAILNRGTSGSARATADLIAALEARPETAVDVHVPSRPRTSNSLANALADARWDLRDAGRQGPEDLFVSPCNTGAAPRGTPHLLVAYDTMLFDHPEHFDRRFVLYSRILVPWSLRRADLVVTLSERSRSRLIDLSHGKAKVEVLQWRGSGALRTPTFPEDRRVLMLGATEPHKRHVRGVEAVRLLRERTGEDIKLDVVGPAGRAEVALASAFAQLDPKRQWTRRHVDVPPCVKDSMLDAAWLLLQPSLDEGFGLPLLEATEHGVPVVHSGAGAMPEVLPSASASGDSPACLADSMERLLVRPAWYEALVRARADIAGFTPAAFEARVAEIVTRLTGH